MLSFQIADSGREIQVHCDEAGVAILLATLTKLQSSPGHAHLRTPSNGGRELDEETPWGEVAIGEVIINVGG